MTDSEVDQKPRKSVAFSEDAMVVDANGKVTEKSTQDKSIAKNGDDAAVDEVTDMFAGLAKKKKKPSKKKEEAEGDGDLDGLDMSGLKKKKKKKPKPEDAGEADEEEKPAEAEEDGDMILGTGVWEHDRTETIRYNPLLDRFFALLHDRNPDLAAGAGKNYKIPPPQCLREGNKKTIFANLPDIAKRLKRSEEHLTQFLFAEMGTSGSTDGSRRLVIKGRFQSKQIENILRRYIQDYVSCKTCRSLNTELAKGENRLWYLSCQSCGSTRTVPAIKTGFSAQIGKRIVSENKSFVNSVFVRGNRDHFSYGSSRTIPLKCIKTRMRELAETYKLNQPLFLIFHGGSDDVRILKEWEVPLGNVSTGKSTAEHFQPGKVYQFDTSELFAALCGNPNERRSLERTSQLLEVPDVKYLHNAGNDAHYTMECMISMASGGPVDTQRETRWPYTGMKKEFKPQRGDADYRSEDEDIEMADNPGPLYPPELAPDGDQ